MKRLDQLSPNVQFDYFKDLLRLNPFYRNRIGKFDEYVFIDKDFYVHCLVDEMQQVAYYSVTTRNHRFHPEMWPNRARPAAGRLGITTFAEIAPDHLTGVDLFVRGATRPSQYIESIYLGNPGNYQTFLLGLNEHGPFEFDEQLFYTLYGKQVQMGDLADEARSNDIHNWLRQDKVVAFRTKARPNTYGITSPNLSPWADFQFGPDPIQMRTYVETSSHQ